MPLWWFEGSQSSFISQRLTNNIYQISEWRALCSKHLPSPCTVNFSNWFTHLNDTCTLMQCFYVHSSCPRLQKGIFAVRTVTEIMNTVYFSEYWERKREKKEQERQRDKDIKELLLPLTFHSPINLFICASRKELFCHMSVPVQCDMTAGISYNLIWKILCKRHLCPHVKIVIYIWQDLRSSSFSISLKSKPSVFLSNWHP